MKERSVCSCNNGESQRQKYFCPGSVYLQLWDPIDIVDYAQEASGCHSCIAPSGRAVPGRAESQTVSLSPGKTLGTHLRFLSPFCASMCFADTLIGKKTVLPHRHPISEGVIHFCPAQGCQNSILPAERVSRAEGVVLPASPVLTQRGRRSLGHSARRSENCKFLSCLPHSQAGAGRVCHVTGGKLRNPSGGRV